MDNYTIEKWFAGLLAFSFVALFAMGAWTFHTRDQCRQELAHTERPVEDILRICQ
jgi:hypothetical protein